MRAGLFGGTFNPIHNGHLMVAQTVLRRLALDCLYFIPCRQPPHKSPAYLAPVSDRLRMLQMALPADERYRLSEVETRRQGPSYTIDTVASFAEVDIPGAELYLIMGLDAFVEIHTWKAYKRLLRRVQPVVVSRRLDAEAEAQPMDEGERMDAYVRSQLPGRYRPDETRACWQNVDGHRIHLLSTAPLAVSSSQIRRRLGAGQSISDLVPAAVQAYIDQKELYR